MGPWVESSREPSDFSSTGSITVRDDGPVTEDTAMTIREEPETPRKTSGDGTVQPGPYPTPVSTDQQPSKRQNLVKYGRWSNSGKSWFTNRRAVPGDRPPPQGVSYIYRPANFKEQPESPTPKERQQSVVSSVESEPIITRPRRRRLYQRSDALHDQNAEVDPVTTNKAENSDGSSDDSDRPIIRRRRRPLSPIRESTSYLSQQSRDSPFRETSLASDLHEGVQNRVRRRKTNLRRSKRLNPPSRQSSVTPPVATRTRRSQASIRTTPRRLRSGKERQPPIKRDASEAEEEAEETAHESSEQGEDAIKLEESESEEVVVKPQPRRAGISRRVRNRPSSQPSAPWVRRSQRPTRAGPTNPILGKVEPGRMTLKDWVDEEDALQMTPLYVSSGSEYEGG